ncbi:MAG: anaerobic ribonucleoside-triphosphate reductase [Candidatus Hydrogenedentota bacterium]
MDKPEWSDRPMPQQGALDIQLSIPHSVLPVSETLQSIIKRDNRTAPFDTLKISEAIFQAAQSIGGDDRALSQSLAASVSLYLAKQQRNEPLNVTHVDDAVERVLIEMGHERTALAYVQHRDKRHTAEGLPTQDARSVRDALMEWRWNRSTNVDRPLDELDVAIDELGLAESEHESVRKAVHESLSSLPTTTPSVALIHELVRAHSNLSSENAARQLHLNLDQLEDALSGTSNPSHDLMTPGSSDVAIARRVKEAYALNRLYSPDVVNAHIRGDLHLHHLEQADRIDSLTLHPDTVKRFGSVARWMDSPSPARKIETLIEDLVESTRILQEYCAESIQWEAINYALAPYLVEFDDVHLHAVSRQLIDGLIDTASSSQTCTIKLHISWDVPHDLQGIDAMGPNGANTGKPYQAYQKTAQDFAHMLLQALRETAVDADASSHVMPVVSPPAPGPRNEATVSYLNRIALCGLVLDTIEYRCDADSPLLPFQEQTLHPKSVVAQQITLNLPRLAFGAQEGHHFWTALDHLFDVSTAAVLEKRRFVCELARRKKNGPYSYLTIQHNAQGFADLERSSALLAMCGLPECSAALQSIDEFQGQSLSTIQESIVAYIDARCQAWTAQSDVVLQVTAAGLDTVAERLTGIDSTHFDAVKTSESYGYGLTPPSDTNSYREFEKQLATLARHQSWLHGSTPIQRPDADTTFPEQLSHTLEDFFKGQPDVTIRLQG